MAKKEKETPSDKLITPKARLSYPSVFKPDMSKMGGGKYQCTLIFDVKDADVKTGVTEMKKAALAIARKKLGAEAKMSDFKHPFRDGAEKAGKAGYGEGTVYMITKNTIRPGVVGANPKIGLNEEDLYAGCYVRASLQPFWWDNENGKGVSFGLCNIQKMADGERFGADNGDAASQFGALEGGDEETEFEDTDDDDNLGL